MNHTFQILEFNKIIDLWEMNAYTDGAKEKIKNIQPILNENQVKKELKDTSQARQMIDTVGMPPMVSFKDMEEMVTLADKGGCLMPEQLEYIASVLTAVKRLKEYLERGKSLSLSLAYYEIELDALDTLKNELQEKIRGGRVDDYASKLLKNLRQDIEKLDARMKEKAEIILRNHKKYLSEQFITTRSGRICLPVKKEYKGKVSGQVVDKSSTGSTFFIEPDTIGAMNEEITLLKFEEENEERRILYELTGEIAERKETLFRNQQVVEKLDFIFAKGKLSADMKANEVKINTEGIFQIKNGRHPLMEEHLCVPLNMNLGSEADGMIITGPNTGGKTVSIKTTGLFSLMVQCGLHIPMEDGTIAMRNQVLCDIGDGQNMTESLSTFSAHITNVLEILKTANSESLVIMDELGSGTDPTEGMGIAIAVLEELRKCGCKFLVTTHYPEVKTYAETTPRVLNARMAFDRETLRPLYRLEIGISGESCALYIAKRLGMPSGMIKRANQAAYGTETIDFMDLTEKEQKVKKTFSPSIVKAKKQESTKLPTQRQYQIGDSVMVYPDEKLGILCRTVDDKGMVGVQIKGKKIEINQKRIKLQVAADQLYPEDYDFSIIFDTVENRKKRHKMGKKHQEDMIIEETV